MPTQLALVGCGYWGQNLARAFSQLGVLNAVVDVVPRRADMLSLAHHVPSRSWEDVLSDKAITAVALATPAGCHVDMAVRALETGKHVFVEKPLALTVAGGERIASAAEKSGKVVMVGHVFQYHPAFKKLKSMVHDGGLGQIQQIYSTRLGFGRIRSDEDVFSSLAPHDISMILELMGQAPAKVTAEGSSHLRRPTADVTSARLIFSGDTHAHILVSWLYPHKERKLVVVGDRGMAVFDDCQPWERKLVLYRHRVEWEQGLALSKEAEAQPLILERKEPLAEECRNFIDCIATGQVPCTDIQEGLAVVRTMDSIRRAMQESHSRHLFNGIGPLPKITIPLVDLEAQKARIKPALDRRISEVLRRTDFIMGKEVAELEEELASYTGSAHVVSCGNGTDALTLALMALGIGPGDAVLVPAFTFVATVEPIALLGAVPIILDVEPSNLTIDTRLVNDGVETARKAGHRPVAIIAVDIFGHPADYTALNAAAVSHGLVVVADAAQSFGATVDGRRVGTLAKITTTSFFPSKPLGCYGDGGAVFTNDANIAETMRSLRVHGRGRDKFDNVRVGMNSRLDTIQAAVLLCKLEVFPGEVEQRQNIASRYHRLLDGIVTPPSIRQGTMSAWASYTIRSPHRDALAKRLGEVGIPTAVCYPRPLNQQAAYGSFPIVGGECPVAERAAREVLSLPMHPYVEKHIQAYIKEVAQLIYQEPGMCLAWGEDNDRAGAGSKGVIDVTCRTELEGGRPDGGTRFPLDAARGQEARSRP